MARCAHLVLAFAVVSSISSLMVHAQVGPWKPAHATFYGDIKGNETKEFFRGMHTTALSTVLFDNGATYGACFEIMCYNSSFCLQGDGTIKVTATNFCPPNYDPPLEQRWCNPPQEHFDLSMPMFLRIAQYKGGIVPVMYRRIPCVRQHGIMFEMDGNRYWTAIMIYIVAGTGDVSAVAVKTDGSAGFTALRRNWGQVWEWPDHSGHIGQGMSIQVTTSDGKMVQSDNVIPANRLHGKAYEGKQF